jgi:pectate lyase C
MTLSNRRLLIAAGLCATFACTEADDTEPDAPWLPDGGAPIHGGAGGGSFDAGARPGGGGAELDAAPGALGQDAEPVIEAGAGGSADAGRADAGAADAGRTDAGRADPRRDGGQVDASTPSGAAEVLRATIVVSAGMTFDGEGRRFIAGSELGDGSQSETQQPLFKLEDGARLVGVVIGAPAADGIHTHGDVTLENIVWEDIGEDALTIKESGTVVLNGGSARNGEDKVFQINAASTFRVSNFEARDAGKFIRQNGQTTFKVDVFIDDCDISSMDEAIFRTDSPTSTVTMTNTRYSNIGEVLFKGVAPANVTTSNNTAY